MLLLLTLLSVKHFICDFVYQPPFMWRNKGTYGHVGGIAHSGFHAVVTCILLLFFANMPLAFLLAVGEFLIHYHMDWFKMKYNALKRWAATTHSAYWVLLGFDQLVHSLTYIGIVAIAFN